MGIIKFRKGQDPRGDKVPKDAQKMGEIYATKNGAGYLLPRKGVTFITLLTLIMAFIKTYFDQVVGLEDELAMKAVQGKKMKLSNGKEILAPPQKTVSTSRVLKTLAYIIHDFLIERVEDEQAKKKQNGKSNSGILVPKNPSGIVVPKK